VFTPFPALYLRDFHFWQLTFTLITKRETMMKIPLLPSMCRLLALICLLLRGYAPAYGQLYVDSLFSFQETDDVSYGQAVDFAGNVRDLKMDICVPVGDNPGPNGRPLMVFIHGGAWLGGSKLDGNMHRMMQEFAERGYVTASINYRLGMFQTQNLENCNVSPLFNIPWNCLQMQDTSEWYRAVYRGAQDAHGAVRYMINASTTYLVDPDQVFLVGESAGGFIAMAAAYLDLPAEKLPLYGALPNALAPNGIYDVGCVQYYSLDTNIASLRLTRPDLGPIHGTLNPTTQDYTIRGVGSFYGAMFQNLLTQSACANPPALYMFHQADDIVVPQNFRPVLQDYQACLFGGIPNCGYIYRRAWCRGSKAIRDQIRVLNQGSQAAPPYQYDSTNSNVPCLLQASNPGTGHSIDNFALRTRNMAVFFENYIGTSQGCTIVDAPAPVTGYLIVYPNPTTGTFRIRTSAGDQLYRATLRDLSGKAIADWDFSASPEQQLSLPEGLAHGLYLLQVETQGGSISKVLSFQ
jgi:Carboxylesterase family/alpha/beta hydrolase fold